MKYSKALVSLLSLILLSSFSCNIHHEDLSEEDIHSHFQKFVSQHHKHYSETEAHDKYLIFKDNLKHVEDLNKEFSPFMDISNEEFSAKFLGNLMLPKTNKFLAFLSEDEKSISQNSVSEIPVSFDWRTKGVITQVRTQGECESSAAISLVQNVESKYAIKNGKEKLMELSVQQVVDCSDNFGNKGCNGEYMGATSEYIYRTGLMTEKEYPYVAVQGVCKSDIRKFLIKVDDFAQLSYHEDRIASYLYNQGPVSAVINSNTLKNYQRGSIIKADEINCNSRSINFAVLIVGYGENSVDGKFWIVKNCWGNQWGDDGYFRIERGTSACGINSFAWAAVINDDL